ncbi:glycosyltransferase [Lacihabitans sp. LS3-19]|uniref:glycosyltransferase family 2 protein n=1 Tax=Lacihabitans sp. LS3-19 TaxID=2487335 RepID=UPI0020CEC1C0|nr:glycosyltransferase family 2 protein [Lacihabitans sp. LS3-19]MCP9767646.1 glycosyltransferase [Lacihabitans sp. LS3-19]
MPLVSIITITFNAEDYLQRTIDSIRNQSSKDFEYILIDGGSKDDTMEIVKRNENLFDKVISEKDKGLYDAMNKGLIHAKGDYVWFMNAGDQIAENDAIEKIKKLSEQSPDVIYSDTLMIDNDGNIQGLRTEVTPHKIPKPLIWEKFKMGMLVCHQSFIVKREIAPFYILDNLSADIDWEINCLKKSNLNLEYPGILSKYLEGGVSHKQIFKSWKDRYIVLKKHFGFFSNVINHLKIVLRADFFSFLRLSKYIK